MVKRLNQKSMRKAKILRLRVGIPSATGVGSLTIKKMKRAIAIVLQMSMAGCEPAEMDVSPFFHSIESPTWSTLKKWMIAKLSPTKRNEAKRKTLVAFNIRVEGLST